MSTTFTVFTDNNPLTYVLSSAKLEATRQRWVSQLSDKYSRQTITAICNSSLFSVPVLETLSSCCVNIVDCTDAPGHVMTQVELRQLKKSQRGDPVIGVWLRAATDKRFPHKTSISGGKDHLTMSRHFDKFVVKRGLLYREIVEKTEKIQQLVVPSCLRKQILLSLHNQVGHPGREKL